MSRIHEALKKAEQELQSTPKVVASVITDAVLASASTAETVAPMPFPSPAEPDSTEPTQFELTPQAAERFLARVRRVDWKPDETKLLFLNPTSQYEPGMEEFRTLRSRLYQLREKTPLKTLMVASAVPGEGKTFVSSNLAHGLVRQHGRRVLLVDSDLRKPQMHECLGATPMPGLSDYLSGAADELAVLQQGPIQNLFFIGAGTIASNASELISNGRLKLLLQRVAPFFDWIVIDSPPVIPVADGLVIARCVNGVVLVVRVGTTSFEAALKARQELKETTILGVVLNRGEHKTGYGSSSYYSSYGRPTNGKRVES